MSVSNLTFSTVLVFICSVVHWRRLLSVAPTKVPPTSVDPIVATLFACQHRMEGPTVVLIGLKSGFAELLDGPSLASFKYELAVNLDMRQDEFERRCAACVSVDDSLTVLRQLDYRLPTRLPDVGALTQALTQSPRMPIQHIDSYVERCQHFGNKR
jgi:hypothetical protein